MPYLATQFELSAIKDMQENMQLLAEQLRPLVKNRSELQSYGNIQMALKDMEKAILIFRLNTLLFPNETAVWNSLTEAAWKIKE